MPSSQTLEQLSDDFCRAFYDRKWPRGAGPDVVALSPKEAYLVQDLVARRRVARGESVVGYKVGCTSAAVRLQFGLQEPIYGRLFDPHTRQSSQDVDWSSFANCAIEPEMVLRIGKRLTNDDLGDQQLVDAIDYVSPGVELHHFKFWRQPPTTQELICSGGIHAGLIIGQAKVSPRTLNFHREIFSVCRDGAEVTKAAASEIMGGPLNSLRWLVKALAAADLCLEPGSFVIPGSPVELVSIDADTELTSRITSVGELTVRFRRR